MDAAAGEKEVFTPKIESLTSAAAAAAADFWCPSGINRTATAAAAATSSSRAATTAYESETELYSTQNFQIAYKVTSLALLLPPRRC